MQLRHIITTVISIVGAIFLVPANYVSAQNESSLNKIDRYLQSKFLKSNIPGFAVVIVHHNEVVFSKGYGKTGNEQLVTGNTPFAIASLSKAFTALAVLQLVDSGKINLDSTIEFYLPSFPVKDSKITIRQLLNQTSGLSDKLFPEMKFNTQPSNLETSIGRLSTVKLAKRPGAGFNYHNPNYQILARLVEVTSGEVFSDYLHNHILMPLKMTHTYSFSNSSQFYSGDSLAGGHAFVFGHPVKTIEPDWFVEGSAGMVSSVNDMAQWLILHLNNGNYKGKQLLSIEGIKAMQTPPNGKSGYGMGWFANSDGNLHHSGILWTYQAEQLLMMDKGYGVLVLFNSGLNAFQDYASFTQGISTVLNGQSTDSLLLPTISFEVLMGILLMVSLVCGIRRIRRLKVWKEKALGMPKFQLYLQFLFRLIPLGILLCIPQLFVALSGRVLSWERIFWTMPSIIIWLGVVCLVNLVIVIIRLKVLYFNSMKNLPGPQTRKK